MYMQRWSGLLLSLCFGITHVMLRGLTLGQSQVRQTLYLCCLSNSPAKIEKGNITYIWNLE